MNVDSPVARRRLLTLSVLLLMLVLCALLFTGCGPNPSETYVREARGIYNRWRDIRQRWDSLPGDPQVIVDFAELQREAKLVKVPAELSDEHRLFLESLRAEGMAFGAYLTEGAEQFNRLDTLAAAGATKFWNRMKERGLTN